jgi:hypothetical protein
MDYTDVGRAIAGRDLLQGSALTRDISGREYTLDVDYSLSEVSIQQSGQRFVDVRPAPLIRSFAFEMLPRAEAHQMLELIMLRIGVGGELLMIPDDDLTTDQLVFEGIYGYLERASMTPMRATENGVTDVMWNVRLTARELLCE